MLLFIIDSSSVCYEQDQFYKYLLNHLWTGEDTRGVRDIAPDLKGLTV
jgi:hypothetical protein